MEAREMGVCFKKEEKGPRVELCGLLFKGIPEKEQIIRRFRGVS
jgi:hypothetical protein